MKILIVDDSRAMRMIVRRTLRKAGLGNETMEEAEDGVQALAILPKFRPDIVLSDWNMPNMSGMELLQQIRARRFPVRFGFVTSQATVEMRDRARKAGSEFLIAKPFTVEAFKDALARTPRTAMDEPTQKEREAREARLRKGFKIPPPDQLSFMYGRLLGRPARVLQDGKRLPTGRRDPFVLAVYRTEDGAICGVAAADFTLTAVVGAALSLFPPQTVMKIARSGQFEGGVWDNVYEVFNVSSRMFHDASSGQVTVDPTALINDENLEDSVRKFIRRAGQRIDFRVEVSGYGGGTMALFAE